HLMFRYRMADRLRVSAMKSGDPRPDEHYEKSKWRLEAKDAEEREYRALVGVLEQLHKLSCRYLRPFLDHRRTTLLVTPHVTLAADGRAVHEVDELIVGKRGEDLWLFELLRESPARFGQCRCGNVYAQRLRGRRRRFCSPRCAAKYIPSA